MYAVHTAEDRLFRDDSRESETECDRLCKKKTSFKSVNTILVNSIV